MQDKRSKHTYLLPVASGAEDGLDQLGVVHVDDIWADAHHGAVSLVKIDQLRVDASSGDSP